MPRGLAIDAPTWRRLDPLLDAALNLPPAAREAWLAALPAQHDDLISLLRSLLAHEERVDDAALLEALPALDTTGADVSCDERGCEHAAGALVGPYRLLRELGRGGMGVVWLAERADGSMTHRAVALKLPFGPFHADLVARIEREREILAALDHPHIARLYDAGVTAHGQPWLALERVEGQRIDHHCEARRLSVRIRLDLFLQAARAVAHAHSLLVVHRDLKPSNLLVDAHGRVKLLDFGIAKLLEGDGVHPAPDLTQQGARLLTLDYAAPEQITSEPVGTRSDVYSLGVLLFELLTGSRPYRLKRDSRAALEEAILSAEPPRPSAVAQDTVRRRALSGDLDTIVAKALKKAPADRYATVDAMADDIERHLSSRPVLARPDSAAYRARTFIVRNRVAVGVAVALTATLCAGAGAALWQASAALAERRRAEEVKNFIASIFTAADPFESGSNKDTKAVELLWRADKQLDASIGPGSVRVELTNTLGASLLALGDIEAAEPIVHRAVTEAERNLVPMHAQTLRALYLRSQVHRMRGRPQEAAADADAVLPMLRTRAVDAESVAALAQVLLHRTALAQDLGAYADAERSALEGFELTRARLPPNDPDRVAAAISLAQAYRFTRKFDLALPSAEQAYRGAIAMWGEAAPSRRMSEARGVYARALADTGDLERGIALLERTVSDVRAQLGPKSQSAGVFLQNLVAYQMDIGALDIAAANAAEALEILGSTMARDAPAYAIAEHSLAAVHLARRDGPAALAAAAHAAEVLDRKIGAKHDNAVAARTTMALALMHQGRLEDAAREVAAVTARLDGLAPTSPQRARVALARGTLARRRGDAAAAQQHLHALVQSADPSPKWQRERMRGWAQLGHAQLDAGAPADALASFERALAEFKRLEVHLTPAHSDALQGAARARAALQTAPPPPTK